MPEFHAVHMCNHSNMWCVFVALMKLNDGDQSALQVLAAILISILWGLMVVFPFVQVSDREFPLVSVTLLAHVLTTDVHAFVLGCNVVDPLLQSIPKIWCSINGLWLLTRLGLAKNCPKQIKNSYQQCLECAQYHY